MLFTINEVKSYTFSEFKEIQENRELGLINQELTYLDKAIGHLRRNKKVYLRLVLLIAIVIDKGTITSFAAGTMESKIQNSFMKIMEMLFILAKFGCCGMGLKDMVFCLLEGGNMKEALFQGIKYWFGYLFLQFYPDLYV